MSPESLLAKQILSSVAVLLSFAALLPYVHSVLKGRVRPHLFSWLIWGCVTSLVAGAQMADGGGVGVWPTGLSAVLTFGIAFLAMSKGADKSIVLLDWIFLSSAGLASLLWLLTSTPLTAVIILSIIDLLGFGPSARKAYTRPHEESITLFSIGAVRGVCAVAALENYSLTTILFPAVAGLACLSLTILITLRRRVTRIEPWNLS